MSYSRGWDPASPGPIRIPERDRTGVVLRLEAAAAEALGHTGLVEMTRLDERRWLVRTCGKVGAVQVGELDLVVVPRIGVARLLFLVGYAADPGLDPDEDVAEP